MDHDSSAGGAVHDLSQSYTSLQDLLAQSGALASFQNDGGPLSGTGEGPGGRAGGEAGSPSAGAVDFNDLLAQFTLPGGALSPGGLESAKSPDAGGLLAMLAGMGQGNAGQSGSGGGGFGDLSGGKNAQDLLLESLKGYTPGVGTPGSASAPSPAPVPSFAPQQGVDFQAQLQQLLAQSLANGAAMSGTPTPTGPSSSNAARGTAAFHPPSHLQQSQNSNTFSSQLPTAFSHPSQPASAHASPMSIYPGNQSMPPHSSFPASNAGSPYMAPSNGSAGSSYGGPSPQHQQQQPAPATLPNGFVLPPSLQQAFSHPALQQGQQNPITAQAQLAAMQLLINAQAQVQAQAQAAQMQAQAQAQQYQQQQHQQQHHPQQQHQQHQHAADPHAHAQAVAAAQLHLQLQQSQSAGAGGAGGATGMAPPPNVVRNGSLTASSLGTDGSYRENEFIFSPLMSPAMTPHSVFTNASSLPPSVGPVPLVAPSDFFPPLTSPALGPQLYPGDHRLSHHRNSLQGLVDGVGALSTQLPPPPGSPSTAAGYYQSPRLNPTDAGTTTGAGAGRRGAGVSSKKTRPSPLMKPTDPSLDRRRRKQGPTGGPPSAGGGEKRRDSKSATSSPFLGPTISSNGIDAQVRAASVTSGASSRPSPPDGGVGASQASISTTSASVGSYDTPSPVDLSAAGGGPAQSASESLPVPPGAQSLQAQMFSQMMQQQHQAHQAHQAQQQSQQQPYQLEPMGPPPVPQHLQQQQQQSIAAVSTSAAPVTPASFMNFSSDFDMNTLSALGPIPQAPYEGSSGSMPGSAFSSMHNSPALLPQGEHNLPTLPAASIAPSALDETMGAIFQHDPQTLEQQQQQDEIFVEPPLPPVASTLTVPPSSGKAPRTRKSSIPARGSPALKAVDAKGKGKATASGGAGAAGGSAGAAGGGGAATASGKKKPQKIAPSPRIGPSPKIRPLLASGPTDAQGRPVDGNGDILALPAAATSTTTNGSSAATGGAGGADTRRSSHKVAEQKRRDSLKLCFDELRQLLPPILPYTDESDRRPGDGNVGGQRHGEVDMSNPNKGVSKVALLRRSNEYLEILRDRIERRDRAISALRMQLGQMRTAAGLGGLGEEEEEVPGLDLDLDSLDKEEKAAGNLAFYEDLDFDSKAPPPALGRKPSRRSSSANSAQQQQQQQQQHTQPLQAASERPNTRRRTTRTSQAAVQGDSMDFEGVEE
ncbi:hypothetical protein JCM11251_007315 [Rhodosporidiobolus azoricus]